MKSERTWLVALIVAVALAATAAAFFARSDAAIPQKDEAARTADLRCVDLERFVVRGGDPLTGSLHVMKKRCTAKLTAVLVDGVGPKGERAHLEQKVDVSLSGDDLVELRDDEAHDDLTGWSWTVELQFESALNPGLRSAFCSKGAAEPVGLKCNALEVLSQ